MYEEVIKRYLTLKYDSGENEKYTVKSKISDKDSLRTKYDKYIFEPDWKNEDGTRGLCIIYDNGKKPKDSRICTVGNTRIILTGLQRIEPKV